MTRMERLRLKFRMQIGAVEGAYNWKDGDLAEALGCDVQTVRNIRKSPVSSKHTAVIEDMYNEILYRISKYD